MNKVLKKTSISLAVIFSLVNARVALAAQQDEAVRGEDRASVSQKAKTGTGGSAGASAGQTIGESEGILNPALVLGTIAAAAVVAAALEAATDNDRIDPGPGTTPPTTTTPTTTTTTTTTTTSTSGT